MFGKNHTYKGMMRYCWGICLLAATTTSQAQIYLSHRKAKMDCQDIQKVKIVSISAGEYMQPMSRARLMHELRLKVRGLGLDSAYLMRRDTDAAGQERFTAMAFRCRDKKEETKSDSAAGKGLEQPEGTKEGLKAEPAPSQENTETGLVNGTEKSSPEIKPPTNQAL